MDGEPLVLLSS